MIQLYTVGGYNEVGKNCTAIKVDGEVILLDMGIHLEKYINYTENEDICDISARQLIKAGAIPDVEKLGKWKNKVRAIIPTHAHLDHVGAIPYLAGKFRAPVVCTPFTKAVIRAILRDEGIKVPNRIVPVNTNARYKVSDNIEVEFINMTHSTPDTVMAAIHTKEGTVLYANDFKFDNFPTLGKKPNYKRLRELGREKEVVALIVDSIYASRARKTPSESVAKCMLKDVMLNVNCNDKAMIVTTFSSHLARLKSIIQFGKQLHRKILLVGRSLAKYVKAGQEVGLINFSKDAEIVKFGKQVRRKLKKIANKKEKYLVVCTGHQGEPNSVLTRIANQEYQFKPGQGDVVIFSSKVIPTKINQMNRAFLEESLKGGGARIFKDIHQSGHASREDLRDLINMVKPKYIVPAHGDLNMSTSLADLAIEMGYTLGENVKVMQDHRNFRVM